MGTTTHYRYDGKTLLQEADGSDDLIKDYTVTDDEYGDLISEYDAIDSGLGTGEFYQQFDAQYAANAMLDDAGSVVQKLMKTSCVPVSLLRVRSSSRSILIKWAGAKFGAGAMPTDDYFEELMNQERMMSFEDLLTFISRQSPKGWLYLPRNTKWNLKSPATILESEEVPPELEDEPDAGVPEFAKINHLQQVLPISTLQQIIVNLRTQKSTATMEEIFRAFEFYCEHDAFMELAHDE